MSVDPLYFGVTGFVFPTPTVAADYPAVGDVRSGVAYNFGTQTGTLTLPSVGDVRYGTLYGAGGTEYNGTLVVPSSGSGPFDFQARLQEITRQIPDLVTVTYEPRLAGDNYDTPVAFEARRGRITSGDAGDLAKRWCVWYLYATAGQTVKPARLGRITDPNGLKFDVYDVTIGFGNLHFVCNTIQNVASGS